MDPSDYAAYGVHAALLLAGLALGFGLGLVRNRSNNRRLAELDGRLESANKERELAESGLAAAREELKKQQKESADYHALVNAHFKGASDRLRDFTLQYRAVYQHLAEGASALTDGFIGLEGSFEALPSDTRGDAAAATKQAAGTEKSAKPDAQAASAEKSRKPADTAGTEKSARPDAQAATAEKSDTQAATAEKSAKPDAQAATAEKSAKPDAQAATAEKSAKPDAQAATAEKSAKPDAQAARTEKPSGPPQAAGASAGKAQKPAKPGAARKRGAPPPPPA